VQCPNRPWGRLKARGSDTTIARAGAGLRPSAAARCVTERPVSPMIIGKKVVRALALVGVAGVAAGCSGAQVHVRNHSAVALHDVEIATNGATARIDSVAAASEATTSLCPRGEAGRFELSFMASGQEYRSEQSGYFECDVLYRIDVEVLPAFGVTTRVGLR
jgi:hypothetical protein